MIKAFRMGKNTTMKTDNKKHQIISRKINIASKNVLGGVIPIRKF